MFCQVGLFSTQSLLADVRSSFPKHPDPVFSAAPSRVCVCVCQLESEPAVVVVVVVVVDPVFSAAPSRVCVCVCQLESEPASQQPQLGEAAGRDCAVRLLLAKRGGCAV